MRASTRISFLGFIFYKYLSEKEEQFFLGEGMTAADMKSLVEEDEETVGYAQNRLGYFISYQNLFSTWVQAGNDFAVSQVYEGLSAFSRLVSPLYKMCSTASLSPFRRA